MCHTETYHLINNKKEPKHEWGDITPPFTTKEEKKMTKQTITYSTYSILCNKVLGWLCVNQKDYNTRDIYGTDGREADWGTIERVATERYINKEFVSDALLTEAFECIVYDNDDYSFMPRYVTDPNTNERYSIESLMDMANRVSSFEVEKGIHPNYIYVENPNPTPSPVTECSSPYEQTGIHTNQGAGNLGQRTPYYCGPHSLMQCIYDLTGIDMSESTLASWAGTTTSGTGHSGLETALARFNQQYNQNLSMKWYSFSDLGWDKIDCLMDREDTALFFHLLYRNQYGHYELPYKDVDGESSLTIANSLGSRQGNGYYGYFEKRSFNLQEQYIHGISQKSVCVITKG